MIALGMMTLILISIWWYRMTHAYTGGDNHSLHDSPMDAASERSFITQNSAESASEEPQPFVMTHSCAYGMHNGVVHPYSEEASEETERFEMMRSSAYGVCSGAIDPCADEESEGSEYF